MSIILTNANKSGRAVELEAPEVLDMTTVDELVEALGETVTVAKILAQLTVDFRSKVRGLLEATDSDGEQKYGDDAMQDMDFSAWVPEIRQKKTVADKASELFADMTPEQIKAALEAAGLS